MLIPEFDMTLLRLQLLKSFNYEVIDHLMHNVSQYTAQEYKKLENRAKEIQSEPPQEVVDKNWLETLLDDDYYFLDEAQKLCHELALVALYKKIEITIT